jgi:hypothetical protein
MDSASTWVKALVGTFAIGDLMLHMQTFMLATVAMLPRLRRVGSSAILVYSRNTFMTGLAVSQALCERNSM